MNDLVIPHPRETYELFGHEDVERHFAGLIQKGKLGQGYLLHGLEGIGKATFAYRLMRYLLSGIEELDAQNLACSRSHSSLDLIEAQSHPDVLVLEAEAQGGVIKAEAARDVRRFMQSTAAMGGWRVVLVDGADKLNTTAANALLKVLEEPSEKCLFLLVCQNVNLVLPTIRSRCQKVSFEPLQPTVLQKVLRYLQIDVDGAHLELARGSVHWALSFQEGGFGAKLAPLLQQKEPLSGLQKAKLANDLSKDNLFDFNFLRYFFDLMLYAHVRAQSTLAQKHVLAKMWEAQCEKFTQTEVYNLDKRALILQTLDVLYPEA